MKIPTGTLTFTCPQVRWGCTLVSSVVGAFLPNQVLHSLMSTPALKLPNTDSVGKLHLQ